MNRGALKYHVAAALFSAAVFVGVSPIGAYTYSDMKSVIDTLTTDENDLVLKNSQITVNDKIEPQKESLKSITLSGIENYNISLVTCVHNSMSDNWITHLCIKNIPNKMSEKMYADFVQVIEQGSDTLVSSFNKKYNTSIIVTSENEAETNKASVQKVGVSSYAASLNDMIKASITYSNNILSFHTVGNLGQGQPIVHGTIIEKNNNTVSYNDYQLSLDDAAITITDNSTLITPKNVKTSKNINVTDNSRLIASDNINSNDIYSDKAINSTTNDQGESIVTPGNITATGALKSDTYIGAVSGAVSGNTVYSGGNIVSANSIKAGGKAKGNVLNVAAINAASVSITGNQSISGVFTTTGQAKLNGGAKLGNKKITGLSAGTLSTTSTEAVNGAQLNTIKQKLTSAGKSYTAGSDIAISSANAISVSKTGAVKSGDTGIVTGGTVYTETNSLNTKLNGLKDLVNSHQTMISSLQQQMGDLNQTISDINSNVASATSNLSNQLKNCLKSDMGNLSAAGRTAIKNIVSESLKSMGRQSSQTLTSPVATFEATSTKGTVNSKDVESVQTALADKLDKSALSDISIAVDANTKQISSNADNIHSNASSIESLKSSKSDISGSNIDTAAYASKLGIGNVVKGDSSLLSGDIVYSALTGKADISYVDSGIGMMENQMEGIKQQATHDMNRVGAGASALACLHPSAYNASDKLSFASGYGHYKNANTSALGAFYHPNDKTMVSIAGTIGNKDAMLSAGFSIKLGMSDHVSKLMVTPKMFSAQEVANQEIRDHLDTQHERLQQIEAILKARVNV